MTILDLLRSMHSDNEIVQKSLDIIKDNHTSLVNNNYELVLNELNELSVKIPSLQKMNEYEYKNLSEYEYSLIMCMRMADKKKPDIQKYMLSKFMELYKEKLELFFKDVQTTNDLKLKIKTTKSKIDNTTYISIVVDLILGILLGVLHNLNATSKILLILLIVIFIIVALAIQLNKENSVKKILDAYISLIKTDWYRKVLMKEYIFLCNFS